MVSPLFFGADESPLYGVLHAAAQSRSALLICSPLGYELMRSHRALKSVAEQCSKNGIPGLRFDYFGTGHSAGSLDALTLSSVLADIESAAAELRQMTGCRNIHVLGLRTGALLALKYAIEADGIDSVTLWDPVWSGELFLEEMEVAEIELHRQMDPYLLKLAAQEAPAKTGRLGYVFDQQFEAELKKLHLPEMLEAIRPEIDVTLFLGGDAELPEEMQEWRQRVVRVAAPNNWSEIDNFGSVLLPQEMIRAIVQHIGKHA